MGELDSHGLVMALLLVGMLVVGVVLSVLYSRFCQHEDWWLEASPLKFREELEVVKCRVEEVELRLSALQSHVRVLAVAPPGITTGAEFEEALRMALDKPGFWNACQARDPAPPGISDSDLYERLKTQQQASASLKPNREKRKR